MIADFRWFVVIMVLVVLGAIAMITHYELMRIQAATVLFTDMEAARQFHNKCCEFNGRIIVRPYTYGTEITCKGYDNGFRD